VTDALQELAALLGGDVNGNRVSCPGPGHSIGDRSLSVTPAKNDDGFVVHSFAGDDRHACIEHVMSRLDPGKRAALAALGVDLPPSDDPDALERALEERRRRIERAREIWDASVSPFGTPVEAYLWRERHLDLTPDVAGDVIRYHPACPWKDNLTGKVFQAYCMIAAVRDIGTNEIVGVQRTRLSLVGEKLERRMLGIAAGAAVKVDSDDLVTHGLHIGEGIETCLTARQLNLKPVWGLGSKGQIAKFPVLGGIETLTVLAEPDAEAEVRECAQRWYDAKRVVLINRSKIGSDLNDALRGAT
jgi:putative DNA primase/helicase